MASRRLPAPPLGLMLVVAAYAVSMAYLEAAVVVYLRAALGLPATNVFPVDFSPGASPLGWIEVGREAATLVMIAGVGWIAGRTPMERLAWSAVVFGIWDIGYYGWLWVFSGWPTSLGTWDLLFLLPLPWTGPVWAPVAVSAGLIVFGLLYAGRERAGARMRMSRLHLAGLVAAGLVVVISFLLNATVILSGEIPEAFAWPVFVAGLGAGLFVAADGIRGTPRGRSAPILRDPSGDRTQRG